MNLCPFSCQTLTGIEFGLRKPVLVFPVLPLPGKPSLSSPCCTRLQTNRHSLFTANHDLPWNKRLTKVFVCTGSNTFFWSEQKTPELR